MTAEPLELVLAEAFEGACGPDKEKPEPKKYYKKPKHPKKPKYPKTKKWKIPWRLKVLKRNQPNYDDTYQNWSYFYILE